MKITFKGTFTLEDMELINDFLEQQQSSDRERTNTIISLDFVIDAKIEVNKNKDIKKISFRKVR